MPDPLILASDRDGVRTLTMNNPRRLNGWTQPMLAELKAGFAGAASDEAVKALILTGTGTYYSAGVNLGGTLQLGHPKTLHRMIVEHNQAVFETFLRFPKPLLAAVNGPAIGAPVTSATLCDALLVSDQATLSTPFARLGVAAEGCSSVHFARLMGAQNAERMLGPEGFAPTGAEAVELGLATEVVPQDQLTQRAQAIAAGWVEQGKTRSFRGGSVLDELLQVNARESVAVADSFLARPFLKGQAKFLLQKKKWGPGLLFTGLWLTQRGWSRLL